MSLLSSGVGGPTCNLTGSTQGKVHVRWGGQEKMTPFHRLIYRNMDRENPFMDHRSCMRMINIEHL